MSRNLTWRAVALVASLGAALLSAQPTRFARVAHQEFKTGTIRAAVLAGEAGQRPDLVTLGTVLREHKLPGLRTREVANLGVFGGGACAGDVNGDGRDDIVALQTGRPMGRMVWLEAPQWQLRVIDREAEFRDCLVTELFGQRGAVVLHRYSQVRFYAAPPGGAQRWPYQELYSIYTPSAQGGLLRADIDGDRNADLVLGNYWLRSPAKPGLPWQLYAINRWWERPRSARLRVGLLNEAGQRFPHLVAAQAEMSPARAAWFARPADPRKFWSEARLEALPPIRQAEALATADFNGDGFADIAIGENAGPGSRLLVFWNLGKGRFQATQIELTRGLIALWALDYDGDGDQDLVGAGPDSVSIWRNQPLK